jgi:prepilin-type N-terminal cleavage/methylation domain-containing protein
VRIELPVENCPPPFAPREPVRRIIFRLRRAFSLVEVLIVVALLSLIVLVLMTVFNSTQSAFRTGVTQTDILGGGRAAMELIVSDLKTMTPSGTYTNAVQSSGLINPAVGIESVPNFFANTNFDNYQPLYQSLTGSGDGALRTNVLENLFIVSRQNLNGHDSWVGTGYTVNPTNTWPLFPLYRFATSAPASSDPTALFNAFLFALQQGIYTNAGWSHLIDGVVDLRIHAFDVNGYQMITNGFNSARQININYTNVAFMPPAWGEAGFYFFSNTLPASVEVQLGTLEDHVLQRAGSLPLQSAAQINYLAQEAGRVHVFRQRVLIPNVDPTVYPAD